MGNLPKKQVDGRQGNWRPQKTATFGQRLKTAGYLGNGNVGRNAREV